MLVATIVAAALILGAHAVTVTTFMQQKCGVDTGPGNHADYLRRYEIDVLDAGFCLNLESNDAPYYPFASTRSILVKFENDAEAQNWVMRVGTGAGCLNTAQSPAAARWLVASGNGPAAATAPDPTVTAFDGFAGTAFGMRLTHGKPFGQPAACEWSSPSPCVCITPNPAQLVIGSLEFVRFGQ